MALKSLGSDFEWLPPSESGETGLLKTITAVMPAIRVDAGENRSNRKTFFNSLVAAYTGSFLCFVLLV